MSGVGLLVRPVSFSRGRSQVHCLTNANSPAYPPCLWLPDQARELLSQRLWVTQRFAETRASGGGVLGLSKGGARKSSVVVVRNDDVQVP